MSPEIANLIEEARSQHFETSSNAITSIALLLERVSMSREGDASYEPLLPVGLYRRKLSPNEVDALVLAVTEILKGGSQLAGSAAWALGKTRSARVVPDLITSLRNWRGHDDFTAYNILIALADCGGLESARSSVEEILRDGADKPSSMEYAQRIISRMSAS